MTEVFSFSASGCQHTSACCGVDQRVNLQAQLRSFNGRTVNSLLQSEAGMLTARCTEDCACMRHLERGSIKLSSIDSFFDVLSISTDDTSDKTLSL